MYLYLMQHGEACAKEVNPDRPLTDKGKLDIERMASWLKSAGVKVEQIFHSGKLRARQTAESINQVFDAGLNVSVTENINPNDDPRILNWQIESQGKNALVVGHLPYLAKLVSLLLSGNEELIVPVYLPGSIVCVEYNNDLNWRLAWMVRPDLLS